MCSIVYDTTIYDRNTVDMKRVIYGPFTVVIITITVGYVNVNDRILSFTIVVSIDLGMDIHIMVLKYQLYDLNKQIVIYSQLK
jgi:hypothetical protein